MLSLTIKLSFVALEINLFRKKSLYKSALHVCGDSKQTEFSLKRIKLFLNNILQFESIIFERKRYFRKAIKDSFSEI